VLFCAVAARVVGDVLPVGDSNYVIVPGFSNCELWRHHCCHGNHSWNELEFCYLTVNKAYWRICKYVTLQLDVMCAWLLFW